MENFRSILIASLLSISAFSLMAHAQVQDKPDLSQQPTLYVVGYAHLDTEWRWEYPQVIDEYLRKTMEDNFKLFDKYPHYIFNFSGANRYRFMKEYYPADFAQVKKYVDQGRWFPAGSSMEEGDVNAPNAEAIIRQILYGNEWFQKEFGKSSAEYMLPDCFGFPSSLPTILAHSGVKGFSTQKLTWGSSAPAGGKESLEETPVALIPTSASRFLPSRPIPRSPICNRKLERCSSSFSRINTAGTHPIRKTSRNSSLFAASRKV